MSEFERTRPSVRLGGRDLPSLSVARGWAVLTNARQLAAGQPDLELFDGVLWLSASAGQGAAAVGGPLWWLLVERVDAPGRMCDAAVGTATDLFAHPLVWAMFHAGFGLARVANHGPDAVGAVDPGDAGSLLAAVALVSRVEVPLTGAVTVPVRAGTGLLLARVHQAVPAGRERTPADL